MRGGGFGGLPDRLDPFIRWKEKRSKEQGKDGTRSTLLGPREDQGQRRGHVTCRPEIQRGQGAPEAGPRKKQKEKGNAYINIYIAIKQMNILNRTEGGETSCLKTCTKKPGLPINTCKCELYIAINLRDSSGTSVFKAASTFLKSLSFVD